MILRWLVASLHLIALPIGLGAVVVRGTALRGSLDKAGLDRVFRADTLWGLAAFLWISTGVARAFFGLEKGTGYYVSSIAFWSKMTFLFAILVLEIRPMAALVRWRRTSRRGDPVDTSRANAFARISFIQAGLVVLMVFAAAAMARGLFH